MWDPYTKHTWPDYLRAWKINEDAMVETLKRKYEGMLTFAESQAVGFQKQLKVEKKLQETAESKAANAQKSLLTMQALWKAP